MKRPKKKKKREERNKTVNPLCVQWGKVAQRGGALRDLCLRYCAVPIVNLYFRGFLPLLQFSLHSHSRRLHPSIFCQRPAGTQGCSSQPRLSWEQGRPEPWTSRWTARVLCFVLSGTISNTSCCRVLHTEKQKQAQERKLQRRGNVSLTRRECQNTTFPINCCSDESLKCTSGSRPLLLGSSAVTHMCRSCKGCHGC